MAEGVSSGAGRGWVWVVTPGRFPVSAQSCWGASLKFPLLRRIVDPWFFSDVVGPWFSAVSCDFTRYPGLACFVQDPDILSFVERRETLACMSVIVGLHRRLSAIQMLTLCNSDGRWRGAGRKQCGDRPAHQHLCRWWQLGVDWGRSKVEHGKV